jgi:hypothetical protein
MSAATPIVEHQSDSRREIVRTSTVIGVFHDTPDTLLHFLLFSRDQSNNGHSESYPMMVAFDGRAESIELLLGPQ